MNITDNSLISVNTVNKGWKPTMPDRQLITKNKAYYTVLTKQQNQKSRFKIEQLLKQRMPSNTANSHNYLKLTMFCQIH